MLTRINVSYPQHACSRNYRPYISLHLEHPRQLGLCCFFRKMTATPWSTAHPTNSPQRLTRRTPHGRVSDVLGLNMIPRDFEDWLPLDLSLLASLCKEMIFQHSSKWVSLSTAFVSVPSFLRMMVAGFQSVLHGWHMGQPGERPW